MLPGLMNLCAKMGWQDMRRRLRPTSVRANGHTTGYVLWRTLSYRTLGYHAAGYVYWRVFIFFFLNNQDYSKKL